MPGGPTQDPEAWPRLRDRLHRMKWNVYAKRPFGGAEQVIRYLGLYTHRVGISNHRLVSMDARAILRAPIPQPLARAPPVAA
jgi:hypothetical protein